MGDHLTIPFHTRSIDDKNIFCLVQTLNEITAKPKYKKVSFAKFVWYVWVHEDIYPKYFPTMNIFWDNARGNCCLITIAIYHKIFQAVFIIVKC